jgi:hypothetical protein
MPDSCYDFFALLYVFMLDMGLQCEEAYRVLCSCECRPDKTACMCVSLDVQWNPRRLPDGNSLAEIHASLGCPWRMVRKNTSVTVEEFSVT